MHFPLVRRLIGDMLGQVCPDAVCEGASSQQASKADTGNHYTFGVHEKSGGFQCFRCSAKGNWYSFKQRMSGNSSRSPIVSVTEVAHGRAPRPPVLSAEVDAAGARASASMFAGSARGTAGGDEDTANTLGQTFLQYAEALPGCSPAIDFLTGTRLIREDVLKKFKVGVALYTFKGRQLTCVTFPWFNKEDELPTRVKVRAIEDKRYMRLDPSGGPWGFFGWSTVEDSSEEVVLTEGELDALSVYQETGLPAVSLPNGARSFPPDLLEQLEQFKTIYIWCDDDVPGREGADMCVKKLGRHRCRVVKSRGGRSDGPKDANEVLVALSQLRIAHHQELAAMEAKGGAQNEEELASVKLRHAEAEAELDMRKMLQAAAEVQHEHVISFRDLRDEVKQQFQDDLGNKGTSFGTSLPSLDRILKGHRSGELTIMTGRTGQGKTTVCSQISLDLCEQGVHTLWGSFEVKNVRLAAKMLQQHSRASLKHCTDVVFDEAADAFTNLPLWFLGYYGSTGVVLWATAAVLPLVFVAMRCVRMCHEVRRIAILFSDKSVADVLVRACFSADINDVLDAMEYAVYVHDVRHVIIDNLQVGRGVGSGRSGVGHGQGSGLSQVGAAASQTRTHSRRVYVGARECFLPGF